MHLVRPAAGGLTARQTATLAALPQTFRASDDGWVHLVDGGPGWTGRARESLGGDVRALIVDHPGPAPVDEVRSLRDATSAAAVTVVVDSPYVGSPTWVACREHLIEDAAVAGVLDGLAVVREPEDTERALLALVAVARPLLRAAPLRRPTTESSILVTDGGDLAVSLAAAVSVNPGLVLDVVGARVRWRLELPDDGTARPGRAARYDAQGESVPRPVHATSSRTTWRALADRLDGGSPDVYDLDTFLLDLEAFAGP